MKVHCGTGQVRYVLSGKLRNNQLPEFRLPGALLPILIQNREDSQGRIWAQIWGGAENGHAANPGKTTR